MRLQQLAIVVAAASRLGVVEIPAVRKGLSNQRMRVIQDVVSAMTLDLAVRLPQALSSRRGCHYESTCYLDYQRSLRFWDVFDREATLEGLRKLGARVVEVPSAGDARVVEVPSAGDARVAPLRWPLVHSDLAAQAPSVARWVRGEGNVSFSIANPEYCCLLLLPDSTRAVTLVAGVNDALVAAKRTRDHAGLVLSAYRARLGRKGAKTCAVHWRDDDDFVVSNHKLDRSAYARAMAQAIGSLDHCGGALLVLGDIPTRRLRPLLNTMNAAYCDIRRVSNYSASCLPTRRLYTKQTLLRSMNWSKEYDGWDDLLGMVDFELGTLVDSFVGSPFSSFSVLIAVARGDTKRPPLAAVDRKHTLMPETIDVDDSLAQLFRIQFPYSWATVQRDPCAAFRAMSDKYAKRLDAKPSCVFDQPPPRPFDLVKICIVLLLALLLTLALARVLRVRRPVLYARKLSPVEDHRSIAVRRINWTNPHRAAPAPSSQNARPHPILQLDI
ncbi:hypothetical protein CTAYLR_007260 [Chrysophaeum taylorii]|uniref:Uncharacterized protein n=1 Tax=Chrysophaeum taylorii TaxID=2483200 RepID=A0AAD7UB20_9STRA|nr:hypothetical protein CTAYLR_007260 [Chrysophaeum taylorii]